MNKTSEYDQDVVDAKDKEWNNLLENDVFEVVAENGQSCISTRWVMTEKGEGADRRLKARLVARGFEETGNIGRTDSPTCSKLSLRLCLTTAPTMGWEVNSIDVTSAFLQGGAIEREVYLEPPIEYKEEGKIWRLKRCIYGLADAPRAWYEKVAAELIQLGAKLSQFDSALFF